MWGAYIAELIFAIASGGRVHHLWSALSPASTLPPSGSQLLVSEKFVSLQGEGRSTGAPAAFLRLGNCNLKCVYCDTAYTWDETRYDLGQELTAESIEAVARWIAAEAPGRVIITGGEPLLQQKLLAPLLARMDELYEAARPMVVEVETNGTVTPSESMLARVDQWNVSPKLHNSGESPERRFKEKALSAFVECDRANFKFVIVSESQALEVDEFARRFSVDPDRIALMPEATSAEVLRDRAPQVAQAARGRSYRYSGRLHLELFGSKRGV